MTIEFDFDTPVAENSETGYRCKCCGTFIKTYTRSLNSSMCLVLLLMVKHKKFGYFHVEDWLKEIGRPELRADYHKLRFYNFLEKKIGDRSDGSPRNGMYRITSFGIMFAEGKITAKSKFKILNNQFKGFSGKDITIQEALGNKFSYQELMAEK